MTAKDAQELSHLFHQLRTAEVQDFEDKLARCHAIKAKYYPVPVRTRHSGKIAIAFS